VVISFGWAMEAGGAVLVVVELAARRPLVSLPG
jgi:hypothetical protein